MNSFLKSWQILFRSFYSLSRCGISFTLIFLHSSLSFLIRSTLDVACIVTAYFFELHFCFEFFFILDADYLRTRYYFFSSLLFSTPDTSILTLYFFVLYFRLSLLYTFFSISFTLAAWMGQTRSDRIGLITLII
jgi:hypothetical protein